LQFEGRITKADEVTEKSKMLLANIAERKEVLDIVLSK